MSLNEQLVGKNSKETERGLPSECVSHHYGVSDKVEVVGVEKTRERAAHHFINESLGTLERYDLRGESLANSEVNAFERHDIAELKQAGYFASNSTLARSRRRPDMRFHVSRQIEANFNGGEDLCLKDDGGQWNMVGSASG